MTGLFIVSRSPMAPSGAVVFDELAPRIRAEHDEGALHGLAPRRASMPRAPATSDRSQPPSKRGRRCRRALATSAGDHSIDWSARGLENRLFE